ncbi:MAG: hypothetical protein ACOYOQ_00200 [Microthrixaceae bacterium]
MTTKLKDQWTTTREVKSVAGGHKMWMVEGHDGYGNHHLSVGIQFDPTAGEGGWVTLHPNGTWEDVALVANAIHTAYRRGDLDGVASPLQRAAAVISDAAWGVVADNWDEGFDLHKVVYRLGLTYNEDLNNNEAREQARYNALGHGVWGPMLVERVIGEARSRYHEAEYAAGLL